MKKIVIILSSSFLMLSVILFSNFQEVKALSNPQQTARYINVGLENDLIYLSYGEVYSSFRFLENNFRSGGYYGVVLNVESPDSSSALQISATQESPLNDFNYIFDDKENTLVMYESFIYSGDYSLGSYNLEAPKTYVDFEVNNYVYAVFDFINNFTFRIKAYYSNGTFDYLKTYDISMNRNFWFTTLSRGSDSNDYYSGYWTGYNESYDIGYNDAKNEYGIYHNGEWLTSVEYGTIQYDNGYDDGLDDGYDDGMNEYGYDDNGTIISGQNAYDKGYAIATQNSGELKADIINFVPGVLGSIFMFFFQLGQIGILGITILDIIGIFVLISGLIFLIKLFF